MSLLLRLRSSSLTKALLLRHSSFTVKTLLLPLFYSTSPLPISHCGDDGLPPPASPSAPPPPSADPKPTLSSRMSFVFEQIDALHRDRAEKDDALQRIRAWRHSRLQQPQRREEEEVGEGAATSSAAEATQGVKKMAGEEQNESLESVFRKEVEMVHPWPEWIELMERLVQQNYFDHRRVDEDMMLQNVPIDLSGGVEDSEVAVGFWRDWAAVCTAIKNFGNDRFDILRSLSRKDIQVLVGHGCPSLDGKVIHSAKLLRKLAHVNEGEVCSSCNLRSSCGRGFLLVPKEAEARTLDVMRVLLTFGFDSINGSVKNKSLIKMKSVKTVIRKLLHEIVKLSAVPIDPNLPRPVIKKPPPKVKQPPPPPKKRVGRDDIEMKKGDWLCPKCDFMNFAKNAICLQCDSKRPKRQLLPGEWECPECNFLNYRRNMACFHCECKRPPDEFVENLKDPKQHETVQGSRKGVRLPNVSDAWNFDFDENESDGADVAAFEFADSPRVGGDRSLETFSPSQNFNDRFRNHNKMPREFERTGAYSDSDDENKSSHGSRTGFDDFDDEDDDVDSYEIDVPSNNQTQALSRKNFSELENESESDKYDDHDRRNSNNRSAKDCISNSDDEMLESGSEVDFSNKSGWDLNQDRSLRSGSDDDLVSCYESNDGKDLVSRTRSRRGFTRDWDSNHPIRSNRDSDRMRNTGGSFRNNDGRPSRGARRNDNSFHPNGFGDHRRGKRSDDWKGSSRTSQPEQFGYNEDRVHTSNRFNNGSGSFDNRRSRGNGSKWRGGNGESGETWGSTRPIRGERFGFSQDRPNRLQRYSDHSKNFDDMPRRQRIIER